MGSHPIYRVSKKPHLMNTLQELNNKFKIAFETDTEKFGNKLKELGININSIECICCKDRLDLDKIRGVYNYKNTIFFFCEKPKCQLKASHKLLELE